MGQQNGKPRKPQGARATQERNSEDCTEHPGPEQQQEHQRSLCGPNAHHLARNYCHTRRRILSRARPAKLIEPAMAGVMFHLFNSLPGEINSSAEPILNSSLNRNQRSVPSAQNSEPPLKFEPNLNSGLLGDTKPPLSK